MRGSGVTAARSCQQPLVSASRYLAVQVLPGDPLYFVVEVSTRRPRVQLLNGQTEGNNSWRQCIFRECVVVYITIFILRSVIYGNPLSHVFSMELPYHLLMRDNHVYAWAGARFTNIRWWRRCNFFPSRTKEKNYRFLRISRGRLMDYY